MVTSQRNQESWESLVQADLNRDDKAAVECIKALLRTALGQPNGTVSEQIRERAARKLSDLTSSAIRVNCRKYLNKWSDHDGNDHPEVIALAERIFASHATGAPFINSKPYKATWLESWHPEKAPFQALVFLTSGKRCLDWLKSQGRDLDKVRFVSAEAAEAVELQLVEPSRPDQDFEFARLEAAMAKAIDQLPPTHAKDAITAVVCQFKSVQEYAKQAGIEDNTAHSRVNNGRRLLVEILVENGIVEEGFSQHLTTAKKLENDVFKRLGSGMTRKDIWKDSKDGTA